MREVKTHLSDLHLKELAKVDENTSCKEDENFIFTSGISSLDLKIHFQLDWFFNKSDFNRTTWKVSLKMTLSTPAYTLKTDEKVRVILKKIGFLIDVDILSYRYFTFGKDKK